MRLLFARPFLSLTDLPDIELPPFTLLTGVNGAGKSHLLKALMNGAVSVDIAPNAPQDIRMYDWSNLAPENEGEVDASAIRNEQLGLFNSVKNLLAQPWGEQNLQIQVRNLGLRGSRAFDVHWLASASNDELAQACVAGSRDGASLRQAINDLLGSIIQNISNSIPPQQQLQLRSISEAVGRHPIALRYDDFLRASRPTWGSADLFRNSFARLFVAYREAYQVNRLAQMEKIDGNHNVVALSRDEFEQTYGPPPWDFVNTSLLSAGMDFTIDAPSLVSMGPYKPKLHKKGTDAEISFDGLSSGERVLMSFAFAVYYASDTRQIISRPKLLLLDEIDAPLHPSMCKNLLSTIQHVLVEKYKLPIIMTTHSPSTVALAPEDAIHVMRPGLAGVHKVDKDSALKDLTTGVPTLSLNYDGRVQVFVESPKDVDIYQAAFDASKVYLKSQITPVFVATGVETEHGSHVNTGCDVVKRIVLDLRAGGAKRTIGLIDWDGKNESRDGIHILAVGERNGLESVILDPLILLNVVVRHSGVQSVECDWPSGTSYLNLMDLDHLALQTAVDAVQAAVLKRPRMISQKIEYLSGNNFEIDKEYLTMDDHKLENGVLSAYPQLKAISRGRSGELMKWISRTILSERPGCIPNCLIETFREISAS